jgi:hypothetical protein
MNPREAKWMRQDLVRTLAATRIRRTRQPRHVALHPPRDRNRSNGARGGRRSPGETQRVPIYMNHVYLFLK